MNTMDCSSNTGYYQYIEENTFTKQSKLLGCCVGTERQFLLKHTIKMMPLDGSRSHYFRIVYQHSRSQFMHGVYLDQDPCVKLFRESKSFGFFNDTQSDPAGVMKQFYHLPFGDMKQNETYALTELINSPYKLFSKIDLGIVDTASVVLDMSPFYDSNTGNYYNHIDNRTMQVNVVHRFGITFKDIYGNNMPPWIYIDPPYDIRFTNQPQGKVLTTSKSFMDKLNEINVFEIQILETVVPEKGVTGWLDVELTLNGKKIDVQNSPFKGWQVLPAYMDFGKSDLWEFNLMSSYVNNINMFKRPRCYVGDNCSFVITLRDEFYNIINYMPGLIKEYDIQTMLIGPYFNIDGLENHNIFKTNVLSQYFEDNNEQYFINFQVEQVGLWKLFLRLKRGQEKIQYAQHYPISFRSYSDIPSAVQSNLTMTYYYGGDDVQITVIAKDKFSNSLTDFGVKMKAKINFRFDYEEYHMEFFEGPDSIETWDIQERYLQVPGKSVYDLYIPTTKKGWYNLTLYICEERENDCPDDDYLTYQKWVFSPIEFYLQSKFPSALYTNATGYSLSFALISIRSQFVVRLQDKYAQRFNIERDLIHKKVANEQFVKVNFVCSDYSESNPSVLIEYIFPVLNFDADWIQGIITYQYLVTRPYTAPSQLRIYVLDTEPVYLLNKGEPNNMTPEQLSQIDYVQEAQYVEIQESPFTVTVQYPSREWLIGRYCNDFLESGISFSDLTFIVQLANLNKAKGIQFEVILDMRNLFNHPLEIVVDVSDTTPFKDYLLFDFANENHDCIKGSSYSKLREYCEFFSHSRDICISYKMCSWMPNELSQTTLFNGQNIKACQPCNTYVQEEDQVNDIGDHSIVVQDYKYRIQSVIDQPATYIMMLALFQQGGLGLNIYENIDYSGFVVNKRLVCITGDRSNQGGGFNVTFNTRFDPFFTDRTQDYSAVVQGVLRFEDSTYYNLTFVSNLKVEVYIEDKLEITKNNLQNQRYSVLNRYFDKGKLHKIQVHLQADSPIQEKVKLITKGQIIEDPPGSTYIDTDNQVKRSDDWRQQEIFGYLEVYESNPFLSERIILPSNMFQMTTTKDNGMQKVIIT